MSNLLDGCYAKLERAKENVRNLNAEIETFLGADPKPYQVVGEHKGNGLKYAFVVRGNPTMPLRFTVLAGEVVHHLRSILDHLICALVVRNSQTPTRNNQ